MAVIELARKSKGGVRMSDASDLRVYCTTESAKKGGRHSIGIRVRNSVMKRLRWMIGDKVVAKFDDERKTWTVERVTDGTGNALSSQGHNEGHGTVRFACDSLVADRCGLTNGGGYDCRMISSDEKRAVFEVI